MEAIKLIGALYLFMFTVSHGRVEQVFRPAVKLINTRGFNKKICDPLPDSQKHISPLPFACHLINTHNPLSS
jgi:hypothetical protein